jgi:hypothetical protein
MSCVVLKAGTNVLMEPHVFIFTVEVMEALHGVTHKPQFINHLSFLHEQN